MRLHATAVGGNDAVSSVSFSKWECQARDDRIKSVLRYRSVVVWPKMRSYRGCGAARRVAAAT